MNVDVVVIGGGIAGVSAAYEIAAQASVVLVEQEQSLAYHASGRSAATLSLSYGPLSVRRLTSIGIELLENPPECFDGELLARRPFLRFAESDNVAAASNLLALAQDTAPWLRLVEGDAIVDECPMLRAGIAEAAVVDDRACDIDVAALHAGYVRGLRARPGRILTGFRVHVARRSDEHWVLEATDGRRVVAPTVVVAAGAWANETAELLGANSIPCVPSRRTAFMSPSHTLPPDRAWPLVAALDGTFYLKPEGDRYLCSPIDNDVLEPCDARPDDVSIARALDDINRVTRLDLRHVSSQWAGLRAMTRDGLPVVGWDPATEGLVWLAGQGGFGIQTAPALARLAAAAVLHEELPRDMRDSELDVRSISAQRFASPHLPLDGC